MEASKREASSFRDPSGFIFRQGGRLYRQINPCYQSHYDCLMQSGLYQELIESELLIPHEEGEKNTAFALDAYKTIAPQPIPFISYPYEWCFGQLKDAALATLEIQRMALSYGMSLKDCSAYNIQFLNNRPILIDTLSFEIYREGRPWMAYRQFCQHFLAPLALMSRRDIRMNQLLRVYIDGIPLGLAHRLLPFLTFFNIGILLHLHSHSWNCPRTVDKPIDKNAKIFSRFAFLGLLESLRKTILSLNWKPGRTEWANYYQSSNYTSEAISNKKKLIKTFLESIVPKPKMVLDLGSNTGFFSRVAGSLGIPTVSMDMDPASVEISFNETRQKAEKNILPLILDLTNPSPRLGWANEERLTLADRGPVDVVMALALIHHLAISNNLPFDKIASFLSQLCRYLIIEFVPKNDSQMKKLFLLRDDIFQNYNLHAFEENFGRFFSIQKKREVHGTRRTLYIMKRKALL